MTYNLRLGEASSVQAGYGYQGLQIRSVGGVRQIQNFVNLHGRDFDQARLNVGWSRNSYDRMPYPQRGVNQQGAILFFITRIG